MLHKWDSYRRQPPFPLNSDNPCHGPSFQEGSQGILLADLFVRHDWRQNNEYSTIIS